MRDKVSGNLIRQSGAKLKDVGGGTLKKVLLDMFGRVIGSTAATAADLDTLHQVLNVPGVAVGTGVVATERGGLLHRTRLTLSAAPLAVTDALAYGSQKVYTYPEGRILLLGAMASLQFAVTSARAGTINDSASLTWGLGSAAASSITLATTMVDMLPIATKVLAAATTALNTASTNVLAALLAFDGTSAAKDAFLNLAFATNTDIDADGTMTATGTIDLTWINLGDI